MTNDRPFKTYELDLDNSITMVRRDPFGHIFLTIDKGNLPEKYQGAYTTIEAAERDVTKYKEERRMAASELKKTKKSG